MKLTVNFSIALFVFFIVQGCYAQDADFHVYLGFGQSNMEGYAHIEAQDSQGIDPRFEVLQAVDCPERGREKMVSSSAAFVQMQHRFNPYGLLRKGNYGKSS